MSLQLGQPAARRPRAFTLIELLVVVGILALLVSMLLPTLARAKEQARSALCKTNLAGLARANELYAGANSGRYVPAAADIFTDAGNLHRWHGARDDLQAPFDPAAGPLAAYLGGEGKIRKCPTFTEFRTDVLAEAYESGSGGYGYSDIYVGSTFWRHGYYFDSPGQLLGAMTEDVNRPSETIMFTDVAMPHSGGYYTEESFCYCVFRLDADGKVTPDKYEPSIHFRHGGAANVVWCDSHATGREDFHSVTSNVYGADPEARKVGWFGPADNSLFDLD